MAQSDEYWARLEAENEAKARAKAALDARTCGIKALGGIRAFETYTAERFSQTEKNRAAFEAVKDFDTTKDNLFLSGPAGTGKSHLASIAARKHMTGLLWRYKGDIYEREPHYDVVTTNQMTIARLVRSSDGAKSEQAIIEEYSKCKVLVIDDMGIEKSTEFMLSLTYEIIHSRYMNKPGGLIVTSNLMLGQLAEKMGDDRIPSRLAQMCKVFNLQGEKDYRLVKAAERKEKA